MLGGPMMLGAPMMPGGPRRHGGKYEETVAELLSYLETADMHLKEELVLKIAILAERFRSAHEWYVDVILSLVRAAGD